MKQILLAESVEESNEKGFVISFFQVFRMVVAKQHHYPFAICHSSGFPGRREGFRSGAGERPVLTCELADCVFFLGSDLLVTREHLAGTLTTEPPEPPDTQSQPNHSVSGVGTWKS